MTQTALVTALPEPGGDGRVELTISRQSACSHDCASCGGCGTAKLTVRASSGIPLELGDRVEVSSGGVLGIAALVYLGPVVLFLAGYLLSAGLAEPWRYACALAGFALGLAGAVASDRAVRRRGAVSYRVTRKL